MSISRRFFLQAAAVGSLGGSAALLRGAHLQSESSNPSDKLRAAVIGTGGRGGGHVGILAGRTDVDILYLCDTDLSHAGPKVKGVEEKSGRAPAVVQDFRRVLDDPQVDIIATATPNHWHSLISILAMQAGKHVYVEKPVSHNVWEGRQLVGWARTLNKICQCGTQSRSVPGIQEAVKYVQEGNLGPIQYVIGTCYKPRRSIGKLDQPLKIPESLDYDLWCGPAEMVDLYRPRLHYDWHWDFNTGNGDMGNQGIHQMDVARWFLGERALSPRVMSIGGRLGYEDAGNTPNTQIVYHAYEKAPLIFETRGLPQADLDYKTGMDQYRGSDTGVVVQCEKGYVLVLASGQASAHQPDGTEIHSWKPAWFADNAHFDNFITAVRAADATKLNADVFEGHLSSALCHTGSISHRLGKKEDSATIADQTASDPVWRDSYERMAAHLAANGVDISDPTLTVGPWLEMDPESETFSGNPQASELLTRNYRAGYEVQESPYVAPSLYDLQEAAPGA